MILICLAAHANADGQFWVSQKAVEAMTGVGRWHVAEAYKTLERAGYISRTGKRMGRAVVYRLNVSGDLSGDQSRDLSGQVSGDLSGMRDTKVKVKREGEEAHAPEQHHDPHPDHGPCRAPLDCGGCGKAKAEAKERHEAAAKDARDALLDQQREVAKEATRRINEFDWGAAHESDARRAIMEQVKARREAKHAVATTVAPPPRPVLSSAGSASVSGEAAHLADTAFEDANHLVASSWP